jgi:hypothetical protein
MHCLALQRFITSENAKREREVDFLVVNTVAIARGGVHKYLTRYAVQ